MTCEVVNCTIACALCNVHSIHIHTVYMYTTLYTRTVHNHMEVTLFPRIDFARVIRTSYIEKLRIETFLVRLSFSLNNFFYIFNSEFQIFLYLNKLEIAILKKLASSNHKSSFEIFFTKF